eukprot:5456686-Alexandrium_andersonii.AAC.1
MARTSRRAHGTAESTAHANLPPNITRWAHVFSDRPNEVLNATPSETTRAPCTALKLLTQRTSGTHTRRCSWWWLSKVH